jgi:hypothetical protein
MVYDAEYQLLCLSQEDENCSDLAKGSTSPPFEELFSPSSIRLWELQCTLNSCRLR